MLTLAGTNPLNFTVQYYLFNVQNDEHLCSMSQSPYQLMYNLYNIIALTELKGYAMLQFSYMILRINKKVNIISNWCSGSIKSNGKTVILRLSGSIKK